MQADKAPILFGVIDETALSFRSPRCIDGYECETLRAAFKAAYETLCAGAEKVAIVRAVYSERHDSFVEIPDKGCILIEGPSDRANFDLEEE